MRQIVKGPEPPSLTAHRQIPHSTYDNYQEKDELRASLVKEQGGVCCYCMGRIRSNGTEMKIEHWRSQDEYPDDQLTYQNLLGGCKGNEGKPHKLQHCDTRKGQRDLRFNPANPEHHIETRVSFGFDGAISSNDPVFNGELNTVLNLNLTVMKNNRIVVLMGVLKWWKLEQRKLRGPVPKVQIEEEIARHSNGTPHLSPYCQVAIWWLKQKVTRMAS